MFGVQFDITPALVTLDLMSANAAQSPVIMGTLHKRSMTRLGQRYVRILRVEPPRTPANTRLMTPRQRRAFFASNGFGGGIPGTRTHGISQGWQYKVEALDNGGEVVIYNDVPGVNYVEGWDQQPFLAAIGWLFAPPILAEASAEADVITETNWVTASDLHAGVK